MTKWTKNKILKISKKFNTIKDWRISDHRSYSAAHRLKFLSEATKHMKILNRNYLSDKALINIISKFKNLKEFRNKDNSAYNIALRRGLLKNFDHLYQNKKWTKKEIFKSALKFNRKSIWQEEEGSAYFAAKNKGLFKEATKHMEIVGNKFKRCIYSLEIKGQKKIYIGLTYRFNRRVSDHLNSKRFISLIKKYGKKSFIAKKISDYIHNDQAIKLEDKYIKKYSLAGYEILNINPAGALGGNTYKWTDNDIFKSAMKFNSIYEWRKKEPHMYTQASRKNILDKATANLKRLRKPKRKL